MKLSAQDVALFYKLYTSLLVHVNRRLKLAPAAQTPDEIMRLPLEERGKVRNALWKDTDLIETFLEENPDGLSAEELGIVESWKHRIGGSFMLMSCLKKHAIFFSDSHGVAFGVLALADDFSSLVGERLPAYVETVLLPFKGSIIYDGLISSYNVTFGRGAATNIKDAYQQAKANYGIVTSLPFSAESRKESDEDLLRFYLKSQQNRDRYSEDIWDLIRRKPALRLLYHREMGKVHARTYKKRLRESGIEKGWFAVLDANIVASGRTEAEARKNMKDIVPFERQAHAYVFELGK